MGKEIKRCTIITGAPEEFIDYYHSYIADSFIISADSGYDKCVKLGIMPDLIIGDFDSTPQPHTDVETIVLPVRKDDTDTFFAVKEAVKRGYNEIVILGAIGSRLDHTYSNILCLSYCADAGVNAFLINPNNRVRVLTDDAIIKKDKYNSFSLFALFDACAGLTTRGTAYNLTDYTLTPDCQLAQSNEFVGEELVIKFKSGKILLIESND